MRSRLEAAVAAWLDHHEVAWTYERRAYADESGQYLPDFELHRFLPPNGDGDEKTMYVEVKPPRYDGFDVRERMQEIWSTDPDGVLVVWAGGRLQPVAGGFPMAAGVGDGTGMWRRGFAGLCGDCHRLVVHFVDEAAGCRCGWSGESEPIIGLDIGAELVDIEAEAALLGSLIADPGVRTEVFGELDASQFATPAHSAIFDALKRLPPDAGIEDLRVALDRTETVNAIEALGRLGPALTLSRTSHLAHQVRGWSTLRALRAAGEQTMELAASATPVEADDRVASARALLDVFDSPVIKGRGASAEDLLGEFLDDLESRFTGHGGRVDVPTGFVELDKILAGGLRPGQLCVLGARPSVGKSSMALDIAVHVAVWHKRPALFASLEMTKRELGERLMSGQGRIDSMRIRTGNLTEMDWERLSTAIGRTAEAPLVFADDFGLSVASLRRLARDVRRRYGDLALIVVDYLQLMGARGAAENRQVEVAELSRGLKMLAGDLEVPVLACSQLSRQLEMRADKRPMLADLRESGAIENDADVVLFIYRDDLYNWDSPDRGVAEILVAKNRGGPVGVARVAFLEQFTRFANMARIADDDADQTHAAEEGDDGDSVQ